MCAEWFTAIGTIVLAVMTFILAGVAIFPDTIRGWLYKPELDVSIQPQPPDCISVPITSLDGRFISDSVYLRLFINNTGNMAAKKVEVYASDLERSRADNITWDRVNEFPPQNLQWSNFHTMYFDIIMRDMGKHCDLGHVVDPARRNMLPHDDNPRLGLTDQQTSLTFDLIAKPNHRGHIIGPGNYRLKLLIAAENVRRPLEKTISLVLTGNWYADETTMLRDGVNVRVM
jgi:hypothetical protein